jgi:hypothetical protein
MPSRFGVCFLLLALEPVPGSPSGPPPVPRAAVIFSDDFEDAAFTKRAWSPESAYAFTVGRTGAGVRVTEAAPGGTRSISAAVDLTGNGGCLLALSAHLRTEGVEDDASDWTGAALYLKLVDGEGTITFHPAIPGEGTRDWWNAGILVPVPASVRSAAVVAGLEGSAGKVTLDNVRLEVARTPADYPPPRDPSLPIDKGHALGMLRGAMVHPLLTPGDLRAFGGEWNANLVRWQLGAASPSADLNSPDFESALEAELALLDAALPECARSGLLVLVDLHTLSRGLFDGVAVQDRFVAAWTTIARRYRHHPAVWGYDLANEPDGAHGAWGEGVALWETVAGRAARAVRAEDPARPIIVESVAGVPAAFAHLMPLDDSIPGVLYSTHLYEPAAFTHQTLFGFPGGIPYPGYAAGEYWDAARLRTSLRPVRDFQEKYRAGILVGEFSAIRWAPQGSAYRWIRDAIDAFEAYGWDWCYHAFREWHGWSAEHTEDPDDLRPAAEPTDRELLLRGWMALNAKPSLRHTPPAAPPGPAPPMDAAFAHSDTPPPMW